MIVRSPYSNSGTDFGWLPIIAAIGSVVGAVIPVVGNALKPTEEYVPPPPPPPPPMNPLVFVGLGLGGLLVIGGALVFVSKIVK
jgi:hypothetical protein